MNNDWLVWLLRWAPRQTDWFFHNSMKPPSSYHRESGLTLVELLVIIAVVAFLAFATMPGSHGRSRARLTACVNNLHQIGIAETVWADDHKTNFPASLSTNLGGTKEYLAGGRVDLHFRALKDYSLSPQVLRCPTDSRIGTNDYVALENTNISYFASLDSAVSKQMLFLTGDRNLLINGSSASPGFATMTSNSVLSWSKEFHYTSQRGRVGALVFPDCHAEAANEQRMSALTASMGTAANRLVFP